MAEMVIELEAGIHAEIVLEMDTVPANYPVILDPLTESYSTYAKLTYYNLEVISSTGLSNVSLLNNGKNSRLTASGMGQCEVELTIEDELGNSDTDVKIIKIG